MDKKFCKDTKAGAGSKGNSFHSNCIIVINSRRSHYALYVANVTQHFHFECSSVIRSNIDTLTLFDEGANVNGSAGEEGDLFNLLQSWGFSSLCQEFLDQDITIERLKLLTEADLNELFKEKKLGIKVEFRHRLTRWKIENNIPNDFPCNSNSYTNLWINTDTDAANSSSESSVESTFGRTFQLENALKNFPNGNYVFLVFEKNKKLNDAARKIMVDAITAWHIENNVKLRREGFERISEEIEQRFHDDKFIYYKKRGLKQIPSGRLYDKYYNHTKRLKKIGLIQQSPITPRTSTVANIENIGVIDDQNITDDEILNLTAWLRINNSPWTDVQENWRKTFTRRRSEILKETEETRITSILANWPLLKNSHGFNLIEQDFFSIYQDKTYGLIRNWIYFKNKIIPIYNTKIKDKQNLTLMKYLNSLNHTEEIIDVIVALLLHAVLPPTIKHVKKNQQNKKLIIKATIKDSQNSIFLHTRTINDFDNKIEELKSTLLERGETLQPIIVAVGDDLIHINSYYVFYDDIKYKFDNCLAALDSCFKIFHVLNLKYPRCGQNTWIFIQKYFFDIHLPEDNPCSNLLCLLNDLKN
ncbi:uncharacterized protein LOC116166619 [Photinus pyralis]|uniref:uncharacterized protein LOC116166619 n=1 Tax=Photinus pyralis TaxID=7054 RepID=UPI0012675243|nr:uncharacterized protein LOC116166619 [Photinus pyralis]